MGRKLPVWLLGFANLPLGITGAVALLITPQVLAARHVPETTIANVTTLGLAGTFAFFLVAPILDVGFSRKTYAIAMSVAAAILTFLAVMSFSTVALLGSLLFLCLLVANLNTAAIGGWFGSVLPAEDDAPLGGWMTVANFGGFGVVSIVGILLVNHEPLWLAATLLGSLNLIPMAIIVAVQPPTEDRRRMIDSFGNFASDLLQLARRSYVRRLLLLLALPCASFALTNTLGGLGADYGASEKMIAMIAGIGVTVAGVVGSLSVPIIGRRVPLLALYLAIGMVGGLFTLSLLVLPHTPAVYAAGFVTQNLWQSAALATGNALILSGIGKNNPLASTQFAVLSAAMSAPITYMQWIDGQAYSAGGLARLYITDGGLDLAACLIMAGLFLLLWNAPRARTPGEPAAALGGGV